MYSSAIYLIKGFISNYLYLGSIGTSENILKNY